jgi:hypothetical protein
MAPIRIFIMREEVGWSAGTPDDLEFLLLAPTLDEILERLPQAVKDHCGPQATYQIMTRLNRH